MQEGRRSHPEDWGAARQDPGSIVSFENSMLARQSLIELYRCFRFSFCEGMLCMTGRIVCREDAGSGR